jgi:hypothetical protein
MSFLPRIGVRDKLQQESSLLKAWIPHQVRNDKSESFFLETALCVGATY